MLRFNKDLITVELAKFTLERFSHYQLKMTLNLFNNGQYVTYTDDVKYRLTILDNNYMILTNDFNTVVFQGPAHIINDKLRTLYPVLKDI